MSKHNPTGAVDIHAHLVPKDLLEDLAAGRVRFPNVEVSPHQATHVVSFAGGTPTRPISPGLTEPGRRAKWLDDNDVSLQVVGGWLDVFGYELAADEGADWAELLTDRITDAVADNEQLVALGTVPLQEPERAAQMLLKQRTAGLPGVMIATRAGGRDLDDPAFTPFWEAADETSSLVFIHPGFVGNAGRYRDFGLVNGLARLEDSTVTLARLLYAGIPARYPGARIVAAHGGAALPMVLGRLVRNHLLNPDTTADPLESFSHLYFDSIVFDPEVLRFLIAKVGAERVLLGSDFPFPIGDLTPRAVIEQAGLPEESRDAILGGTARRLLGRGGDGA